MGRTGGNGKMEGWLYVIRSNRLGLQCSRKRYFVLEGNSLNCFKSNPVTKKEIPIRNALVDSCIRVTDNGRESIGRKVFFIFTLYNASNHGDQFKLGAASSEEAAKWISSIKEATLKECPNQGDGFLAFSRSRKSRRLNRRKEMSSMSSSDFLDWTRTDPVSTDVIAPFPWTILGCKNGLRLFKETKDGDFNGKRGDDHPAIMAVGLVEATSESIFRTVTSLGSSRAEWDFCFSQGSVVEHLDGHTDIIHKRLSGDWLPWGMKKRDLLLRRYWRREDDGTYVILYHSVVHKKCPPRRHTVRACLKSGGYVISPLNQGKQSIVKHMLAVDWKFWKSYMSTSFARSITIRMLGRVAALREMFKVKLGNYPSPDFSSGELTREIVLPSSDKEYIKEEVQIPMVNGQSEDPIVEGQQSNFKPSPTGSFLQLNDAADEFFDVLEPSEDEYLESTWSPDAEKEMHSQDPRHGKVSTAAVFMKKLQVIAVQKSLCMDLSEVDKDGNASFVYGATLPKDPSCNFPCSWMTSDPSTFLIRGNHYLEDHEKVKANGTLMQMVAADWLKSDKREDNIGGRHGSFVQKHAAQGGKEFFFIVNIQVPGTTTYNLVSYYMMDSPLENTPLLESFVNGDDAYRNSRFKLIPYISKGSWIVKQSVGKKACLVGQALDINYFRGSNYLELGIDVGSSTVARGVVSLVLGYLTNLVIELAFLIQANTQEELPEILLGTCRFNHLDVSQAVQVNL